MIAKKILPLLLLALVFFIPSASVSAYSFPDDLLDITDGMKEKMWTRIFTQASEGGEPYYLVAYAEDGLPYVFTFTYRPVYNGFDGEVLQLSIDMIGSQTASGFTKWGLDFDSGRFDVEEKYVRNPNAYSYVRLNLYPEHVPSNFNISEYDSSRMRSILSKRCRFLYSNFDIVWWDDGLVFRHAPLVLNTSLTQKTTSGAETVETEQGKVATVVVMIAVSSVLLFPFLATFLKKSLHSLLGLPVGSRHGLRKSKRH